MAKCGLCSVARKTFTLIDLLTLRIRNEQINNNFSEHQNKKFLGQLYFAIGFNLL